MCPKAFLIPGISRYGPRATLFAATLLSALAPAHAASCTVSPENVNFGQYDPLSGAALDTAANIRVTCDAETAFEIALGPGGGSYAVRTMTGSAGTMAYNLYIDPQRLVVWGDGSSGSNTVSAISAGGDFAVYARAPGGQNLRADSYVDAITVTVTY